ncbi:MAG: thioredoxin [Anaerolineae bacterium CG_4_9_14_3_um_filter_57_17]|nr:thioredoxin [bacterium]NCT21696.1 thioredoxin [bacterium]OIO84528.1 MAG: thioredoxin [Anaerolineae bacterium CG2_30_57_67]PJB66510.1 MAG: thioredoxin [Anaerolineae bacterium CG_4_9_14_3_um_filter_57_17]
MSQPVHVTDQEFQEKVLNSSTPVVVDFWAPWCGPCKMIAPVLEEIAREQADKVIVAKINTDENPDWAVKYGVMGIPTLLFIKDGKEVGRHVGMAATVVLKNKVQALIDG